jgi:hypothetical protein
MAYTHVQNASGSGSGTAAVTVSALTTGTRVFVFAGHNNNTPTFNTPTVNSGTVNFTSVEGPIDNGTSARCQMWVGEVVSGGATTITVSMSSGTVNCEAYVVECSYTGTPGTTLKASGTTTGVSTHPIGAGLAYSAGDFLFQGAHATTTSSFVAATNWTEVGTDQSRGGAQYRIPGSGGSTTGDISSDGTNETTATILAVFPFTGGGGTAVPVFVHHLRQQGIA